MVRLCLIHLSELEGSWFLRPISEPLRSDRILIFECWMDIQWVKSTRNPNTTAKISNLNYLRLKYCYRFSSTDFTNHKFSGWTAYIRNSGSSSSSMRSFATHLMGSELWAEASTNKPQSVKSKNNKKWKISRKRSRNFNSQFKNKQLKRL